MLRAGFLLLTISGLTLFARVVRADPAPLARPSAGFELPLKTGLKLGRPARQIEVGLSERDSLVADIGGAAVVLPAKGVKSATVESVAVAEDTAVAVVRVSAANGEWVTVLGGRTGRELLLAARTDAIGDPGERRSTVLEITPGSAGVSSVSVATRYEGVSPCGSAGPWLVNRRVLDPKTLKLVARKESPAPLADLPRAEVSALPADAPQAVVRALAAAASSQVDELTSTLRVPHALVDGRAETNWPAEPGDSALLRWSTPSLAIEGFDLLLTSRAAKERPLELLLMLEGGPIRASLPKAEGSDRWRIKLPAKVNTACVAVLVEAADKAGAVQLAELSALSELDRPGGMEHLVSELVQDGEPGAAAADVLADLGGAAGPLVAARFDELSPRARRRSLKVLATALSVPEVRARVIEAARSPDQHLSNAALAVLGRGKEPGLVGLRELAQGTDATADSAARALTAVTPLETAALLAALAQTGGPDRPLLRRALVTVARRDPQAFGAAAEVWLASGPSVSARVGLVTVAADADLADLASATAEAAVAEANSFADRFRLSSDAPQLKVSVTLDDWLTKQIGSAEEWMIRRAAYDALLARNEAAARALAASVARDPYPRVRAGAVPELARAGQVEQVSTLARKDSWPLVRATAATALATLPATRPTLEELLDDTSRRVRAATIDALATQQSSVSWPLVEQRLTATAEWPEVQAAAVRFAAALCVQAARPPLTNLARRSLRPDANDDERRLGLEAIHALHDLGGAAAEDARLLATRESGSPQLAEAITRFGPPRCPASSP